MTSGLVENVPRSQDGMIAVDMRTELEYVVV